MARDHKDLPYKVTIDDNNGNGDNITIILSGAAFLTSTEFKGFIMQVESLSAYFIVAQCSIRDMIKINFMT